MSNLLQYQEQMQEYFLNNPSHHFPEIGKGLELYVVIYDIYVTDALIHLTHSNTFQCITQHKSQTAIKNVHTHITEWPKRNHQKLDKLDALFISKNLCENSTSHYAQFKNGHWLTCLVASEATNYMQGLFKWVNQMLQPVVKSMPS